jgi:Na+-driven multidrug efflux pump
MLTQSAINAIDLLMVGRLPANEAVLGSAAIFTSIILLWLFGGFLSAISVGTQAITARRFSEGNLKKAGQVLLNSITISIISSIILTLIAVYSLKWLIIIITPSKILQQIAYEYTTIRFFGLATMAIMASYKSFYDALGRVKIHMTVALLMNIINISTTWSLWCCLGISYF